MIKQNEIKIAIRNLKLKNAEELFADILMDIDKDYIKIKHTIIRKGRNSIDISSIVTPLLSIGSTIINSIIGIFYTIREHRKNSANFQNNDLDKLLKPVNKRDRSIVLSILAILDKIVELTKENYNVEADIEGGEFNIAIKRGMVEEQDAKVCPVCKTINDWDARYCIQCGIKLKGKL